MSPRLHFSVRDFIRTHILRYQTHTQSSETRGQKQTAWWSNSFIKTSSALVFLPNLCRTCLSRCQSTPVVWVTSSHAADRRWRPGLLVLTEPSHLLVVLMDLRKTSHWQTGSHHLPFFILDTFSFLFFTCFGTLFFLFSLWASFTIFFFSWNKSNVIFSVISSKFQICQRSLTVSSAYRKLTFPLLSHL